MGQKVPVIRLLDIAALWGSLIVLATIGWWGEVVLPAAEAIMADIATDLNNLVAAVTSITADVAAVLAALKAQPNITADQVAQLEAQIDALTRVDADLKAAITPATPAS